MADVSIARQISVSRRQRQLLILTAKNGKKPIGEEIGKKTKRHDSPDSGGSGGGLAAMGTTFHSPIESIGQIASPLNAIAIATQEEMNRSDKPTGTPNSEKIVSMERLVEGKGPVTPTVVIGGEEERERKLSTGGSTSLMERRGKEIGEIKVGIQMKGEKAAHGDNSRREKERMKVTNLQRKESLAQRKSEMVVIENVGEGSSVDSNSKHKHRR